MESPRTASGPCAAALAHSARTGRRSEDDALDLLYLNAEDELRDIVARAGDPPANEAEQGLHAEFYRFLDRKGAVVWRRALEGDAAFLVSGLVTDGSARLPNGTTLAESMFDIPMYASAAAIRRA